MSHTVTVLSTEFTVISSDNSSQQSSFFRILLVMSLLALVTAKTGNINPLKAAKSYLT